MTEGFVELTDGTRLVVNINFATLYYMQKTHADKIVAKAKKRCKSKSDEDVKLTDDESMEIAAKMIYAILRSNGRTVTFDEALMLCPADTESIKQLFEDFNSKMKKFKKKETAKKTIMNH